MFIPNLFTAMDKGTNRGLHLFHGDKRPTLCNQHPRGDWSTDKPATPELIAWFEANGTKAEKVEKVRHDAP
jgi:hypothetical protein